MEKKKGSIWGGLILFTTLTALIILLVIEVLSSSPLDPIGILYLAIAFVIAVFMGDSAARGRYIDFEVLSLPVGIVGIIAMIVTIGIFIFRFVPAAIRAIL